MTGHNVIRDERTLSVENASYRWGYLFLAFGILLIVAYRGLVKQEASWDLLALVIISGIVTSIYQGRYRVLSGRWAAVLLGVLIIAALLGAGIVFLR
ncbi:MAG TPA: hypothetical protein VJK02_02865 [Anaerolineales bacterium]|nr:hypothetical protein [Anaerolineales bacterium]